MYSLSLSSVKIILVTPSRIKQRELSLTPIKNKKKVSRKFQDFPEFSKMFQKFLESFGMFENVLEGSRSL